MKKLFTLFVLVATLVSCNKQKNEDFNTEQQAEEAKTERIISLNGAITETLSALNHDEAIVGVDVTSTYPQELKERVKDLGHVHSITAESILALQPTVVFGTTKDISPELSTLITKANVSIVLIDQDFSEAGTKKLITEVAKSIGNEDYQPLLDHISSKIATVEPFEKNPKVLFIYARGAGNLMVAGKGTPLHKMIELAGAENAAAALTDFKPLTPEALLSTNPDFILMFDSGFQSIGGLDGLLKIEGVAATNAGKNKKVVSMDGQFLSGFGPRLGDAVVELNNKLK